MRFILCFCCLVVPRAWTQFHPKQSTVVYPPQLIQDLTSLRDKALSSDYAYQQVSHLTENIGPRMGGSPQAEFAVQYVAGSYGNSGWRFVSKTCSCRDGFGGQRPLSSFDIRDKLRERRRRSCSLPLAAAARPRLMG